MQPSTSRRRFLTASAVAATGLAGCTDAANQAGDDDGATDGDDATDGGGQTAGTGDGTDDANRTDGETGDDGGVLSDLPDAIGLEPVATGFDGPIGMAVSASDDLTYVIEQPGRIQTLGPDGRLDDPVLDLSDRVRTGYEMGLLGLALHPNYAENRRAFVRYSAPRREGTPSDYSHTFVLAEFTATDDGTRFDTETERAILEIPEPQGNHNAGDLAFGPDGYLYVPTGDGGAANDQGLGHVEDWYGAVSGGNGQDVTENRLGGILRIDVDAGGGAGTGGDGDAAYGVPDDNPLVGTDGLDEYYAWGLRNPWRISFDGEDCYVADVGQSSYEEVNLLEARANYGWNVREGTHCFMASECPTATPDDVRGGEALVDPVIEYSHGGDGVSGASVIGGYVYRGDAIDGLQGAYVFGDLQPGGRLFASRRPEGDGLWPIGTMDVQGASLQGLYSFGRDESGRLYALGPGADGGTLWRLVPAE